MSDLNQELRQARRDLDEYRRVSRLFDRARAQQAAVEAQVEELSEQLEREERDVERLENPGLTAFLASLLGTRDERIAREQQEAVAARLRYEGKLAELRRLSNEIADLRERSAALEGVEARHEALLAKKESALKRKGGQTAQHLLELAEERGQLEARERELVEALDAANEASIELDTMMTQLESARGWGTWDMLGGGLISTSIKHSRLNDAREQAQAVQLALNHLSRELADVNLPPEAVVQLDSFTTFADYFFDGLFVDWVVQSRINDAIRAAESHCSRIESTVRVLERELDETRNDLDTLTQQHRQLLEES